MKKSELKQIIKESLLEGGFLDSLSTLMGGRNSAARALKNSRKRKAVVKAAERFANYVTTQIAGRAPTPRVAAGNFFLRGEEFLKSRGFTKITFVNSFFTSHHENRYSAWGIKEKKEFTTDIIKFSKIFNNYL